MSELLFIRHPETDMAGTFCGHSDPELNARGREQLSELIDRLLAEEIAVVYTSDLRRALRPGWRSPKRFSVELPCACRTARDQLRPLGGITWKEIERRDDVYARRWITEHPRLPAPDGETFQ